MLMNSRGSGASARPSLPVTTGNIDGTRFAPWGVLDHLSARFPNDGEGNRLVAQHLWGNNHWKRVEWLRGLVRFLAEQNLTTYKPYAVGRTQATFAVTSKVR
jgi:hypothetical protein